MADVLRSFGFSVRGDGDGWDDEFYVLRDGSAPPYFVDVCASNNERVIIVEIDGYKGHKSHRQILHDVHRTNEIKSLVKDAEVFRFAFWQLVRMDNETIALELGLTRKGGNNK